MWLLTMLLLLLLLKHSHPADVGLLKLRWDRRYLDAVLMTAGGLLLILLLPPLLLLPLLLLLLLLLGWGRLHHCMLLSPHRPIFPCISVA